MIVSLITPLTISVILLVVYLLIRFTPKVGILLSDLYLFFLFWFAYPNIDKPLATFYLFGLIFILLIDLTNQVFEVEFFRSFSIGDVKFQNIGFIFLSLGIGAILFFMINLMGTRTGNIVIGVPQLATITTGTIASLFIPGLKGLLGIIENRSFFTLLNILIKFGATIPLIGVVVGLAMPIFPIIISAGLFAIYHLVAFSLAFAALIWAFLAFVLYIISFILTKNTLAADFAHWLNNVVVSVSKGLQVVT